MLCFYNLGDRPLEKWDEATNAYVVAHPHEPFFEKPPLWYALTRLSVDIFGFSNISIRLISALSGLGVLFLVYRLSNILAVLLLLTTPHLWISGSGGYFATHNFRSADPDGLFLFFILLSFYLVKKNPHLAGLASGFGILTKGPLALAPLFLSKNIKPILIALATALPWYIYKTIAYNTAFLEKHVMYHIITRISTPLEGHSGGILYYLKVLFTPSVFPYMIPALYAFVANNSTVMKPVKTLIVFILGAVFFTRTTLSWYLLPVYPFFAILLADTIAKISITHGARR